ncbi:COX15/CtaA family protein [Paenibacillus turpanensis]|uniref:COX15/CtaA family protein n=1 Tax=Paenibacillus turpanensis TaxID=2689078 RepID=UPI001FB5C6B5|nr:COX15/CtaA family protein [Paenibacillus turpanensis]
MKRTISWLSNLTFIGMFIVVLMGAVVTNTESGMGCGDDWPLCNGRFVPAYTIESLIEYTHRLTTGIIGLLVLATTIAVFVGLKHRKDAKWYIGSTFFFTFLQAILGALAVVKPQSSAVMALHFGFSLTAFASTYLLAMAVREEFNSTSKTTFGGMPTVFSSEFRYLSWFTAVFSYVVVYLGAFVKHTSSIGGCTGWPLCNGELIPDLQGATAIVFVHRLAAAVLFILVLRLAYLARGQGGVIRTVGAWAAYLVSLQVISGALLVFSVEREWYLFSILLHVVVVSALFAVLAYISLATVVRRR